MHHPCPAHPTAPSPRAVPQTVPAASAAAPGRAAAGHRTAPTATPWRHPPTCGGRGQGAAGQPAALWRHLTCGRQRTRRGTAAARVAVGVGHARRQAPPRQCAETDAPHRTARAPRRRRRQCRQGSVAHHRRPRRRLRHHHRQKAPHQRPCRPRRCPPSPPAATARRDQCTVAARRTMATSAGCCSPCHRGTQQPLPPRCHRTPRYYAPPHHCRCRHHHHHPHRRH